MVKAEEPTERTRLVDMFDDRINYRRKPGVKNAVSMVADYEGKWVLDFGCGAAPKRAHLEDAGAKWVGIDIAGSGASVRGDGHMLPFRDGSFDVVLADAVFEHVLNPFRVTAELSRVCKRRGYIVGYVAFLEPFHMSYFHHSHKGLEYLLQSNGFKVTDVIPSRAGIEKLLEDFLFMGRARFVAPLISLPVRASLFICRAALGLAAALALSAKNEPRATKRQKLDLYRTLLEIGFTGGLVFKAERE